MREARPPLSPLEHHVMAIAWRRGRVTATDVQKELHRPLTNASVRTLLRRLERKRYLRHEAQGRAFVYEPRIGEVEAATRAVRRLVQRFFKGSASSLMAGLVDEGLVSPEEVRALSRRLRKLPGRKG